MPTSGTPEVMIHAVMRRYFTGGSSVESSKRRASASVAMGRTRFSACRYVSRQTIIAASAPEIPMMTASRPESAAAMMTVSMMPRPHTSPATPA